MLKDEDGERVNLKLNSQALTGHATYRYLHIKEVRSSTNKPFVY